MIYGCFRFMLLLYPEHPFIISINLYINGLFKSIGSFFTRLYIYMINASNGGPNHRPPGGPGGPGHGGPGHGGGPGGPGNSGPTQNPGLRGIVRDDDHYTEVYKKAATYLQAAAEYEERLTVEISSGIRNLDHLDTLRVKHNNNYIRMRAEIFNISSSYT